MYNGGGRTRRGRSFELVESGGRRSVEGVNFFCFFFWVRFAFQTRRPAAEAVRRGRPYEPTVRWRRSGGRPAAGPDGGPRAACGFFSAARSSCPWRAGSSAHPGYPASDRPLQGRWPTAAGGGSRTADRLDQPPPNFSEGPAANAITLPVPVGARRDAHGGRFC